MPTSEIDWAGCIEQRDAWVAHNFPGQDSSGRDSMLGVIEEMGELTHAHLKKSQGIRGNEDHDANMRDALADMTVYLWGIMSARHMMHFATPELRVDPTMATPRSALLDIASTVGRLANAVRRDGHVGMDVKLLVTQLASFAELHGWDYGALVNDTWASVRRRDWQRYPHTGLPSGDGDEPSQEVDAPDMDEPMSDTQQQLARARAMDEAEAHGAQTGRLSCKDPH